MNTSITVLAENSVGKARLIGEHGFSVLIERGDKKYLFDTGQGMSLPHNVEVLNKNLTGLNKIIISHGHYDHTGGLKWAIQQAGELEVVAHPAIFTRHMSFDPVKSTGPPRYIGCPYTQEELEKSGASFNFIDHTDKIAPGIWFITGIDRKPEHLPDDSRLKTEKDNQLIPDLVEDDASLLLETKTEPALILGCAHSGILNILDHVRNKMGIRKLGAVLGGTHLMYSNSRDIPRVIDTLEAFSVELVGLSHCTGFKAAAELSRYFGDRFVMAATGCVFNF